MVQVSRPYERDINRIKLKDMLKLKTLITEADAKLEKAIKDIQKKTDANDHTEAVLVLAKFLKDNKSVKLLDAINDIHQIEGNMPPQLAQYRNEITTKLLELAKNKYDANTYMRINSAF